MTNKSLCILCTFCFILIFQFNAVAQMESENFRITTSVISGGGGPMSSDSYQSNSTIGQPTPLEPNPPAQGPTQYLNYPGFWYTVDLGLINDCLADLDGDGDVDGGDFIVFAAEFDTCTSDCNGDFELDNDVDTEDLALFASEFGKDDCLLTP